MDDLELIDELADSDDDMLMTELLFDDLTDQLTTSLLILLGRDILNRRSTPDKQLAEDSNSKEGELPPSFNDFPGDAEISFNNNTVPEPFSEEDFVQLFRVKPSLAEHLATFLCQATPSHSDSEVLPEQQILATLFYLGQEKAGIEDVCDRFNLSFLTFTQIFNRVTSVICNLSHSTFSLPSTDQQKENTKTFFAQHNGLQGVLGCIDTFPVEVTQSKREEKSVDSSQELFILQAVVNENEKFIHIYVSNTAGTDEEILEASKICNEMASVCSEKEYFLGGATYACRKQLLTPYLDSDDISGDEIFFNLSVAACMSTADAALARLTQRFRSLLDLQLPDVATANHVITACCIIHNMADKAEFNDHFLTREKEIKGYSRVNPQTFQDSCEEGLLLRDVVCEQLV